MSWRDQVAVPGSFRGVPFYVESSELTTGRRNVKHVYPFKKEPVFTEDMGREGRRFMVDVFVFGPDYLIARDRLLTALEAAGTGELVHPYYGTRRVSVGEDVRVRESGARGGTATLSIEFTETPAAPAQPSAVQDARGALVASGAAATAAVGAEFTAKYSPGVFLASIAGAVGSASRAIDGVLNVVTMEQQAVARLKATIRDVSASAAALANAPDLLLASQIDLLDGLAGGLSSAAAVNPALTLLGLYHFSPGPRPVATTANRLQERTNFDAAQRLTQRLVVIKAALVAVDQTFASYDDAVSTRVAITNLLDEQADVVADDVFPALMQLRADLVKAVPGDTRELARQVSHTPLATVPSLVLAYRLYGDLTREADVVARNRIRNPMFVTGGRALEVLSRG